MITLSLAGFAFAAVCGVIRLLRGPSLADRIIALDLLLLSLMGALVVDAAQRDDLTYLIVPVVLAIVGFTATVVACRFIENERAVVLEVVE